MKTGRKISGNELIFLLKMKAPVKVLYRGEIQRARHGLQKGAMSSEGGKGCRESGTEEPLTIRSLFPEDYTFPPDTTMDSRELSRKLEEIRQILAARNIEFGFIGDLPDRVIYRYIVNECIVHDAIAPSAADGFTMVLDGCDGVCDSCFQKVYCETGRELLLEEEDFGGF